MPSVTVAIPVRNGLPLLEQTLAAVASQRLESGAALQVLVCDSGSTDGSAELASSQGAEVVRIAPEEFSHGRTRNLLMERSQGEHVAFITQDATPADDRWLERLLGGFSLAGDVALTFGPYVARPHASPMVARELEDWFDSFSPDGTPQLDRLGEHERSLPERALLGRRGFFTDANGCVARGAWEMVPFRPVAYAEDHVLAHDMLRAGFAKAYLPDAAVIHSHDYSAWDWLRRSFDESRAMHEVYGFDDPGRARNAALAVWGLVGADLRAGRRDLSAPGTLRLAVRALELRLMRAAGTMLGTRARRLPEGVVRRLSLEGRR